MSLQCLGEGRRGLGGGHLSCIWISVPRLMTCIVDRKEFALVIKTYYNNVSFTYQFPDSFLNITYKECKGLKPVIKCAIV